MLRIKPGHDIPKLIMVFEMAQILGDVCRMHMVVVDLKQVVLLEALSFAIDDYAATYIASHLPDLLHLFLVLSVYLFPELGPNEVESPLDGFAVAVDFIEKVDVGLLHLFDGGEGLYAFVGEWEFEDLALVLATSALHNGYSHNFELAIYKRYTFL